MLLRHEEGKRAHKKEILVLFTFQYSLKGEKKTESLSPWCLINSDNTSRGREVMRTIILVIVEKAPKNPERLDILLKVTQLLGVWSEKNKIKNAHDLSFVTPWQFNLSQLF